MEFLSINKIEEGSHADCEDDLGIKCVINFSELPPNAREGTILIANAEGKWVIDNDLTKKKRDETLKLKNEVYNKS